MNKLIQFKNIVKDFDGQIVLKGINLDIYENEFVTLLGPSGCGKTTLLRILGGFLQQNEGTILFDGKDISNLPPHKRELNTVFQKYALFPHLNVYDNIAFGLKLKKEPKDIIEQKVMRMLKLVGLEDYGKRSVTEMSGGQQQRVAIARALVNEPKVLLLDEPLGALDMNLRHNMQFEIKRITKELGITTISVTHDQEEAFAMSDKICIMSEGKVQQFGTPEEIYERPANRFVAEFMGTTNIVSIKDMSYSNVDDEHTLIKGITELSQMPMELVVETKYVDTDKKEALFTLRPESIHLATNTEGNYFTVSLDESVYLGERVKIKALAGDKNLNINLKVNEFRKLENPNSVGLKFNPEDISIIYDK